jgi:peroxiredoxin
MLRSIFISGFSGYVVFALIYAVLQLMRGMEPSLSWLGLALAAGAPVAFLAWLYLAGQARTSAHPVAVSVACGLGTAVTMAANWRYGAASGMVHVWAGLCLLIWFVYLRWYSVFQKRGNPALVQGFGLPEFDLKSLQGEIVNSTSFRGRHHVFIFYRGNWCPLCSAQIAELAGQYRELQNLGAEVILISSQPQAHSLRMANRFDAPMQFFQDVKNAAARKLGIMEPFGTPAGLQLLGYSSDTARPTVIISDPDGKILYTDETENYRIRPEPGEFLNILRQQASVHDVKSE